MWWAALQPSQISMLTGFWWWTWKHNCAFSPTNVTCFPILFLFTPPFPATPSEYNSLKQVSSIKKRIPFKVLHSGLPTPSHDKQEIPRVTQHTSRMSAFTHADFLRLSFLPMCNEPFFSHFKSFKKNVLLASAFISFHWLPAIAIFFALLSTWICAVVLHHFNFQIYDQKFKCIMAFSSKMK